MAWWISGVGREWNRWYKSYDIASEKVMVTNHYTAQKVMEHYIIYTGSLYHQQIRCEVGLLMCHSGGQLKMKVYWQKYDQLMFVGNGRGVIYIN